MEKELLEIVNTVLRNRGKSTIENIDGKMRLREDIGFDSLDLAELTVRIESVFDVDVFETGIVNTIEEIIEKINQKKNG